MRTLRPLPPILLLWLLPCMSFAVQVSVSVTPSHCGENNGTILAIPSGGLPPYTYAWDNGPTSALQVSMAPGTYTVTVTDGLGNTAQGSGTIVDVEFLDIPSYTTARSDCDNMCGGWVQLDENTWSGAPPFTYDYPYVQGSGSSTMVMGVCGSQPLTMHVTDAAGCPGTVDLTVWTTYSVSPNVVNITPSCGSDDNGTVTFSDWGGEMWYHIHDQNSYDDTVAFSAAPYTIYDLPAGSYQVDFYDPYDTEFNHYLYCTYGATVVIPSLAEPCGSVSGTVYNDADQDCVQEAGDIPLPYRVITVDPGPTYAITDGLGHYQANVSFGTYTLAQPLLEEAQLCPATVPVPFTVDMSNFNTTVDLADSSLVPLDIRVNVWATQLRPGFPFNMWGYLTNASAYTSGDLSLDLTYDALLGNVLVSPGPTSVSVGAVHWDLAPIGPYGYRTFSVNGTVPADISLLGTPVSFAAHVSNTVTELDLANNDALFPTSIVGSYDPNDKHAVTDNGNTLAYMLEEDHEVTYTIRFQNTGTAAATNVVVRDTIEADLDLSTLKILGASHAFTPSIPSGRVLAFTFSHINLPDSGADERLSHGFVSFSLKPRADIAAGDVLSNTAGIYFDLNPPIITNTSVLPVEMSTGVDDRNASDLFLQPNPATDELVMSLPGTAVRTAHVDVLSMDGRNVHVPVEARGTSAALDVRALSAGAYLVRYSDGRAVRTARFMKR